MHKRIKDFKDASNLPIYADTFQVGNPTYTLDVANIVAKLLDLKLNGIFNLVNPCPTSRFEYVKYIGELFSPSSLVLASVNQFIRAAPVSPNESAISSLLEHSLSINMPSWMDSMQKYYFKLTGNFPPSTL